MKALLIVDLQNDFLPKGSLGVKDGDKIIPIVNALMPKFPIVIASKDWHPEETVHFSIWPVHCVENTQGAAFPENLDSENIQEIFYKGTDNKDDGYSAFEATNKSLANFIKEKHIKQLYIAGIATDFCVQASVLDAVANGISTFVITDATKAVNKEAGDYEKALKEMQEKGAILISSQELLNS